MLWDLNTWSKFAKNSWCPTPLVINVHLIKLHLPAGSGLRIYTASCHSTVEHRASTRIFHLALFLASVLISAQVLLTPLASSSTVLRHVFFGLPLPRLPWGFHSRACLAMLSDDFRTVWPSHPHLRFLICKSILGWFVRFHSTIFVIWYGQKILNIFLKHLLVKTCSLAVILLEFFQGLRIVILKWQR